MNDFEGLIMDALTNEARADERVKCKQLVIDAVEDCLWLDSTDRHGVIAQINEALEGK